MQDNTEFLSNFTSKLPTFLLTGIPGLESAHGWISIPFSSMYTVALTGNCLILLAVRRTHSLHQPMYYFLSMLALSDVGLSLSTLPSTLAVLWFDYRSIDFNACLVQMFFLHSFSVVESSVLLAMSFDRFVAISNPLRYASVLTNNVIIRIGVAIVARATLSLFPVPFLLKRLNYCPGKILLSHSFCFHADVMKLACADTTINELVMLANIGVVAAGCLILIIISYAFIVAAIVRIPSASGRRKAFSTCAAHLTVVIVYYVPCTFIYLRPGSQEPLDGVVAVFYTVITPLLNPIIYTLRNKQMKAALRRLGGLREVHP